jgi:hypothetical protein
MADSFTQFGMTFIFFGFAFIVTAIIVWVSKQVSPKINTIPFQSTSVTITEKLDALKGDVPPSFVDLLEQGVELPNKEATFKMELVFVGFDLSLGGDKYNALTKIQLKFNNEFVNLASATVNDANLSVEGQLTTDLDVSALDLFSLQDNPIIVQLTFDEGMHSLSEITNIVFRTDEPGAIYTFVLTGPAATLNDACDGQESQSFYSSAETLIEGSTLLEGEQAEGGVVFTPAYNGYYAGVLSRVTYYIQGYNGVIQTIDNCPPPERFLHSLCYNQTNPVDTNCTEFELFYSTDEVLVQGSFLTVEVGGIVPSGYYYTVASVVYTVNEDGEIESITSAI